MNTQDKYIEGVLKKFKKKFFDKEPYIFMGDEMLDFLAKAIKNDRKRIVEELRKKKKEEKNGNIAKGVLSHYEETGKFVPEPWARYLVKGFNIAINTAISMVEEK